MVLIDFSEGAYIALKYAMTLAKEMDGSLHLFHVADASNISDSENPLIIQQSIDEEAAKIKIKLKSIVEIVEAEGALAQMASICC